MPAADAVFAGRLLAFKVADISLSAVYQSITAIPAPAQWATFPLRHVFRDAMSRDDRRDVAHRY